MKAKKSKVTLELEPWEIEALIIAAEQVQAIYPHDIRDGSAFNLPIISGGTLLLMTELAKELERCT